MPETTCPWLGVAVVGKVGLIASKNPYVEKSAAPYVWRIAYSVGIVISGANGTDPPAAAGATVPSSSMFVKDAPRASYVWYCREEMVPSRGPSEAVSPQKPAAYPVQCPGLARAYACWASVARREFSK